MPPMCGAGRGRTESMRVLTVNAGSSSLKLRVVEDDDRIAAARDLRAPRGTAADAQLRDAVAAMGSVDAVGHRIVHGGMEFHGPVLLDEGAVQKVRALTDLAPLHQPKALAAMDAVSAALPDVPRVGCFDTAFHATLPPAARTYALPPEWRARWDLRRYGFHGLSHAYTSQRTAELMGGSPDGLRVVTCHLGAGASLAAVRDGRSVDTTMGFTPLEGLVMATRSGSVDPGLVLWLEQHAGTPAAELAVTLEYRSGLLGLAGDADMEAVLARDDQDARLAVDVYVHRLRASIAAMAAAIDGLDALVFTGGVGENAPAIREQAAAGLGFLGIAVDGARNSPARPDAEIGSGTASVRTFVIAAREEVQMAREVRTVLR